MKAKLERKTVDDLLQWKANKMLTANAEYQRGVVWKDPQRKRLIDSVMRGYPIPLIYLHYISREVAGARREDFEIIDGQQRIDALYAYKEGAFKLFDPVVDEEEARFPSFIKNQSCPWGGKRFEELSPELQDQMLTTPLSVVLIETNIPNEARDLFIRLQAGMPLNSQEKRDAWPGRFTEYVLKLGGKPEIPRYPGHDFFKTVMKARTNDRGQFRQLTAQLVMLYVTREQGGALCDINAEAIDSFYHKNLDFDPTAREAKRFGEILTLLTSLLGDGKRKKVIGHEAMGLVLLVDSLLDDYTRSWTTQLASAFDAFRSNMANATKSRYDERPDEYWLGYGQFTRANTDRAETIERRHQFFAEKMYAAINPQMKDPTRLFGELEREIIYYRDKKKCQLPSCGASVLWLDAEVHHVESHSQGGRTTLGNGALVHKHCHPKSARDVEAFAKRWETALGSQATPLEDAPISAKAGGSKSQTSQREKTIRGLMKLTGKDRESIEILVDGDLPS